MLYQRRIPDNQIVSAKLELQLRGGRYAGVGTQLLGILGLGGAALYSVETIYTVSRLSTWSDGRYLCSRLISGGLDG